MATNSSIPVTVFTGFLGAGKTTVILSLLKSLPQAYNVVLLKNEFGDVNVDSELARESNVQVSEMLNGCMCCVLVGQMKNALLEIKEKYHPNRIIIETSGSAFPAPIAWQIRELASNGFVLDSIVTVIDCLNFRGYEDTSYTARLQAQYTDLLLLNKHELVSERDLDVVVDHINTLNEDTPKVKFFANEAHGQLSADLFFGLDTKLFELGTKDKDQTVWDGLVDTTHMRAEVDVYGIEQKRPCSEQACVLSPEILDKSLAELGSSIYRVKGLVRLGDDETLHILNYAFGRHTLTPVVNPETLKKFESVQLRVTVMGVDLRWDTKLRERVAAVFGFNGDALLRKEAL
ncbi:CobW/HypB/UreG, nucleotide-binding domain-containing protein [Gaertneriomyces semiglobifer]|nr:CobW/HypB/UreG, nucleotide-binding domain-containing protein [Gaertneriomyces semiglobifer]